MRLLLLAALGAAGVLRAPSGAAAAPVMLPVSAPQSAVETQAPSLPSAPEAPRAATEAQGTSVLPEGVQRALVQAGLPLSALGLAVIDPAGHLVYQHRVSQPMQTASLMKLVLTLAALEQLGPAFRFHTDLVADPLPPPRQGWQVAIRGGGDPGLQQEALRQMLRQAEAQGVDRLGAPVILDASRFAGIDGLGEGIVGEAGRVWTTLPGALLVDLASVTVRLPADHIGRALLDPPLRLDDGSLRGPRVPVGPGTAAPAANCPPGWFEHLALEVQAGPVGRVPAADAAGLLQPGVLHLRGDWPPGCAETELRRSPLPALDHFGWTLAALWRELGHPEPVRLRRGAAPSYGRIAIRQYSRPLAELVRDINKYSNNLMARTLLLDLAAEQGQVPATPADGAQVIRRWLANQQLQFDELSIENGAGLSHREALSAEHLAILLKYALTASAAPEFLASLSIPGQDGTLLKRFADVPRAAAMRLKSGSLEGVRGLAGYVPSRDGGPPWVVVCMLNAPDVSQAAVVQEALLRAVAGVD